MHVCMYVCVCVCMYVCVCVPYDLENGSADIVVQYIKLTGIIPGVSWATLFSEKKIRKGPKMTKNGPTWLFFRKKSLSIKKFIEKR